MADAREAANPKATPRQNRRLGQLLNPRDVIRRGTRLTVRCSWCAGHIVETLDENKPCPHCGRTLRGSA